MPALDDANEYTRSSDKRTMLPGLLMSCLRTLQQYRHAASTQINTLWAAGSYVSHTRGLLKSSGIYALASLTSPLVALVLAPFLTHHLSHSDYGALVLLNTAILLATGITQLGLGSAFFRAYNRDYASQRDRLGVLSTVVFLLACISLIVAAIGFAAAPWLALFLFNSPSLRSAIQLAVLIVLLQNLTVPGLSWLRAENRARFFTLLSIANLLISLCATILLVGAFQLGITGALFATAGGYTLLLLCTLPLILLRAGLRPRLAIAQNLLSFGLPVAFGILSYWVLQLSDRYLLSYFGSLAQTASYSVAYILGGALTPVIIAPFSLAWPSTMYAIAEKDDAAAIFSIVFRWFSMLLLFATFALSFLATILLAVLFPPAYYAAAPVIPLVALSTMFYGVFIVFTVGIYIQRQTWFVAAFTTVAAMVNVGLNILLIPLYGSLGAALSTLIAYALLVLLAYIVNQRIYPVPFEIGLFMLALFLGMIFYTGAAVSTQGQSLSSTCAIYTSVLALYGGCLLVLGRRALYRSRRAHVQV